MEKVKTPSPINKVFCIGFNKTGTSSIHKFFKSLGLKSVHNMYTDWDITDERFIKNDCFSDGEMHDFIGYDKYFPNSKFILTTRSLDSWLISRIKHVHYRRAKNKTGWMRKEFEQNPEAAVEKWIIRRAEYHNKVLTYFKDKPDKLLVINIVDGKDEIVAKKIARFLGYEDESVDSMHKENVRNESFEEPTKDKIGIYSKLKSISIKSKKYNNKKTTKYAKDLIGKIFVKMNVTNQTSDL